MTASNKIKRVSRILRYLTILYLCMGPICTAIYWISGGEYTYPLFNIRLWPDGMFPVEVVKSLSNLTISTKTLAFLVCLIPNVFSVLALYHLAKLFRLFEGLEFFSQSTVGALRKIGFYLLGGQLTFPLYTALLSLTLTISNPPGQRILAVGFGVVELSWTALAIVLILASWIMDEGRKLQEEQEATI